MNDRTSETQLLRSLEDLLEQVPAVQHVRQTRSVRKNGRELDTVLDLQLAGGLSQRWVVETKKLPLHPYVAGLLALLLPEAVSEVEADYGVVLAPYVSPRSAEFLAMKGIGFCDLSGNCRLNSGPLFIERTGFPNAFARKASLRSLFTPASEKVLRAVLDPAQQGRAWTVRELAAAAYPGVSVGQAHKVVKLLEEQAFFQRNKSGLVLREPDKLLGEWVKGYRFDRNKATRYYSPLSVPELQERLVIVNARAKKGTGGVLASFSAAEVLAPFVRQHRFFAYWRGDRKKLMGALELKPVGSGDNVVILEPYDEGVLYPGPAAAVSVTCPVQTYLDLKASPARGEEAAEAVFDKYLKRAYSR